jgi:hypothetical protein
MFPMDNPRKLRYTTQLSINTAKLFFGKTDTAFPFVDFEPIHLNKPRNIPAISTYGAKRNRGIFNRNNPA